MLQYLYLETLLTLTICGILAHYSISTDINTDHDREMLIECFFFKGYCGPSGVSSVKSKL